MAHLLKKSHYCHDDQLCPVSQSYNNVCDYLGTREQKPQRGSVSCIFLLGKKCNARKSTVVSKFTFKSIRAVVILKKYVLAEAA